MPNFSPTDAAFEGFRFTRERPGAVMAWAGVSLLFNLVSAFVALLVGGRAFRDFQSMDGKSLDIPAIWALFLPAAPALAVILVVTLLGVALVYASALRMFVGIDKRVSFRFGEDERRIGYIVMGYSLIYFAITVVTVIGFGVVESISDAFSPWLAGFLAWVAPLALFAIPTFIIVRLSLAPIIAVDRKRISLKESWVSTKGHFWPLAGSLILSIGMFLVAAFLALMIVSFLNHLVSIGTGGFVPSDLIVRQQTDNPSIPTLVISEIIASAATGFLLPVVLGPLVRAYQAYDAPDPVPTPVHA
jgi:hypothetical protein